MPRPKSKSELLALSQKNYENLIGFINSLNDTEQRNEFPEGTMNRNIRDVLAHLHHWHLMLSNWYEVGMRGEKPEMPSTGHTWKTVPELNRKIWQHYSKTDLEEIKQKLLHSHQELTQLIEKHSNEELFEKKRYKWTGSTSLGAYLISATSSHYDWAFKLIKKAKKERN
jgi:hypothetical protein